MGYISNLLRKVLRLYDAQFVPNSDRLRIDPVMHVFTSSLHNDYKGSEPELPVISSETMRDINARVEKKYEHEKTVGGHSL